MQPFLAFVLLSTICGLASCYDYGYDAGSDEGACRQRTGRSRSATPPCDLARQMYCATAGASYPWHAVRRFVRENRGLMRRMYGDQRHISVLRAEFEEEPPISEFGAEGRMAKGLGNEVYYQEVDREREVEEEVLDAKFVYAVDPTVSIKLGEFRAPPRFRPTTTPTTATATTSTTHLTSNNVTDIISTTEATTEAFTTETAEFTTDTTETTSTQRSQLASESPSSTSSSESAVKGEVLFQDAASEDVGDVSESEEIEEDNHVNYNLKGVNACPVKEEVVAPFWANNTRGELLALLNLYPYEQYVHWEKCTHEHRRMYCRKGCRCEQQYRLHRLLAYDPNNECRGIFSDWFRFPSCCVCKCYDVPMEFRVTSRSPRRIKFDGADGGRTRGNRRA